MAAPKKAVGPKSDKEWRDAVRMAVHELRLADGDDKVKKTRALRLLARRLVSRGLEGDVAALKATGWTASPPKPLTWRWLYRSRR